VGISTPTNFLIKLPSVNFFEETGINVEVISAYPLISGTSTEYLPLPFAINLHWINQGSCEQHYTLVYVVKAIGNMRLHRNNQETDAIRWFLESEIDSLDTTIDIKQEIHLAFTLCNSGTIPS
jgi:hypothetical protein